MQTKIDGYHCGPGEKELLEKAKSGFFLVSDFLYIPFFYDTIINHFFGNRKLKKCRLLLLINVCACETGCNLVG